MNTLVDKIRELKALMQQEFPEGGVSIAIIGETYNSQPVKPHATEKHEPTEYVKTLEQRPPILPIEESNLTMDKIKSLLNAYAAKHGVDAAFGLVEKLSGGSKNPADIPKEKYSYLLQASMVDGVSQ